MESVVVSIAGSEVGTQCHSKLVHHDGQPMTANPTVSVIVPAYNAERTIGETMESVLAQSMGDLELLIIDDGSQDNTFKVAMELQSRDRERIRVLQHPGGVNRGVAVSRNLALDHARGRYVAFLDADDAWLPHKLAVQMQVFQERPEVGFVFGDTLICRSPSPDLPMCQQECHRDPFRRDLAQIFDGERLSAAQALCFGVQPYRYIPSPTPLIKRELFEAGLLFVGPPRLNLQYEDYLMWLCLSMRCSFVAISEPLAIYRVHDGSFTAAFGRTHGPVDHFRGLAEVEQIFLQECSTELDLAGWKPGLQRHLTDTLLSSLPRLTFRNVLQVGVLCTRRGAGFRWSAGVLRWMGMKLRYCAYNVGRAIFRRRSALPDTHEADQRAPHLNQSVQLQRSTSDVEQN